MTYAASTLLSCVPLKRHHTHTSTHTQTYTHTHNTQVDDLRGQYAALMRATQEAARRLTQRVRVVVAVSPARTAALQAKFPALCSALSLVQVSCINLCAYFLRQFDSHKAPTL